MIDIAGQPDSQIFSQVIVIAGVIIVFSLGIWVRSAFDHKDTSLNAKQLLASNICAFFVLGLPLCKLAHDAIRQANDIFVYVSAALPPFITGLSAREEIKKMLTKPSSSGDLAPPDKPTDESPKSSNPIAKELPNTGTSTPKNIQGSAEGDGSLPS